MDIKKTLEEYDALFGAVPPRVSYEFLDNKISEALKEGDNPGAITLMNEMIGMCRDAGFRQEGLTYSERALNLLKTMGYEGLPEYATTLINVANGYRAYAMYDEALSAYAEVERIYSEHLDPCDSRFASLYNNKSLLYQELHDYVTAATMLMKALPIIDAADDSYVEQATTRGNLAQTLIALYEELRGKPEAGSQAQAIRARIDIYLGEAVAMFEDMGGTDFHYSGTLGAKGDLLALEGDYLNATDCYRRAMELLEMYVGRSDAFDRCEEKYLTCVAKCGDRARNLDRCRLFYEKNFSGVLREKFGEYLDHIAIGIVGEGSDAFGFDDAISRDHDYGLGFCIWVDDEVYDQIGSSLKDEYDKLFLVAAADRLGERRGVFRARKFYEDILHCHVGDDAVIDDDTLLSMEEYTLACATNGQIYKSGGVFSRIREGLLKHYPENVRLKRLAGELHNYSQFIQSNYPRMMARRDYVTADICISEGMKSAMHIAYLLSKRYAPYYKWMRRGLDELGRFKPLMDKLDELALVKPDREAWENYSYSSLSINSADRVVALGENIAGIILAELKRQGIVTGDDLFLESYSQEILKPSYKGSGNMELKREEIIDMIVNMEWQQFDKVENEGGRASCQDNLFTFDIMRRSQYMAWPDELLAEYLGDILGAKEAGWNLITEKYARMMKSTAPEEYARLESTLPVRSEQRMQIAEEIIKLQVGWMEEFAAKYPKMAGNARSIHTYEDGPDNTSYETYLRGELGTYSDETFKMYGQFVVGIFKAGGNLAYNIMTNTAKLYGYESVEDAEAKLK
ncbi:MAG: DUF4125 family protein [Lachnospiraceae bacterium]|nr:DUF4125 family protein [Lachnospiraceae bacterium]